MDLVTPEEKNTVMLSEIAMMIVPHLPKNRDWCTTEAGAEWLVERHKAATAALEQLESIQTEKLAATGCHEAASAISRARVILAKSEKP